MGFNPSGVGLGREEGLALLQRARNHDTSLAILAGLGGATEGTDDMVSNLGEQVR